MDMSNNDKVVTHRPNGVEYREPQSYLSEEQKAYVQPIWAAVYFGESHSKGDAHTVFAERLNVSRTRAKEICYMMFYNRNSWGCVNYITNLRSERFVMKMELVGQARRDPSFKSLKDALKSVDDWVEQAVDKLNNKRKSTLKC